MKPFKKSLLAVCIYSLVCQPLNAAIDPARNDGTTQPNAPFIMNLTGGNSSIPTNSSQSTVENRPTVSTSTTTSSQPSAIGFDENKVTVDEHSTGCAAADAQLEELKRITSVDDAMKSQTAIHIYEEMKKSEATKGCFASIHEIVDLASTIPVFTGGWGNITKVVQQRIKQEMQRQVQKMIEKGCNIVDQAIRHQLEPIKRSLEQVHKYANVYNNIDVIAGEIAAREFNRYADKLGERLDKEGENLNRKIEQNNKRIDERLNQIDRHYDNMIGSQIEDINIPTNMDPKPLDLAQQGLDSAQKALAEAQKYRPVAPTYSVGVDDSDRNNRKFVRCELDTNGKQIANTCKYVSQSEHQQYLNDLATYNRLAEEYPKKEAELRKVVEANKVEVERQKAATSFTGALKQEVQELSKLPGQLYDYGKAVLSNEKKSAEINANEAAKSAIDRIEATGNEKAKAVVEAMGVDLDAAKQNLNRPTSITTSPTNNTTQTTRPTSTPVASNSGSGVDLTKAGSSNFSR